MNPRDAPHRRVPRVRPRDRRARVLPDLDPVHKVSIVAARLRRARLHDAAAARGRYLLTTQRPRAPAGRPARRPDGRADRLRRGLDRRAERPAARHRHRARDGHRVRHERRRRPGQSRRPPPQHVPGHAVHARSAAATPRRRRGVIDAEVKRIIADGRRPTRTRLLTEHREVLDALSERLLEKEVIEGDELRAMLRPAVAARPRQASRSAAAAGGAASSIRQELSSAALTDAF